MKLLVVEGNPKNIWQTREEQGAVAYHKRFQLMLNWLGYKDIDFAYPADSGNLPDLKTIKTYAGILLTGSSLNAYSKEKNVTTQLDFAETLFNSEVPTYGSCWGLQIMSVVAGGRVSASKNGREFGITETIHLTEAGDYSPYFNQKKEPFVSLCIHEDEVSEPADNTIILASNSHSQIQAATINYKKSSFFGVQYHPEFTPDDILLISTILSEKISGQQYNDVSSIKQFSQLFSQILPNSIRNYQKHTMEIYNWLESIKNN